MAGLEKSITKGFKPAFSLFLQAQLSFCYNNAIERVQYRPLLRYFGQTHSPSSPHLWRRPQRYLNFFPWGKDTFPTRSRQSIIFLLTTSLRFRGADLHPSRFTPKRPSGPDYQKATVSSTAPQNCEPSSPRLRLNVLAMSTTNWTRWPGAAMADLHRERLPTENPNTALALAVQGSDEKRLKWKMLSDSSLCCPALYVGILLRATGGWGYCTIVSYS